MNGNTIAYNPFGKPIYLMAKPVGALCNLDCAYCYYLDKTALYKGKGSIKMSEDLLEKFTKEYIEGQPTPYVLFTWHGGETLMRGIDFYRKALYFQKKYAQGREISNSIQTNGLLLNDEWCRFFTDNNFLVGISLDGPEHCHDKYRKDRSGRGSFARVMKGIELLQRHQTEFNTLSVVNDYTSQYPVEIYNFFKSIGSRYMQFSPIVERIGQRSDGLQLLSLQDSTITLAPWSVSSFGYGKFMTEIFDEWIKKDVGSYFVPMFDATLAGMIGQPPGVCIYARSCGHAMAMEYNGDVYSCDHFVFPEYHLGNIKTHTLMEMSLSREQNNFGNAKYSSLPGQCKQCDFLSLCHGECPKNRILSTSTGEKGLNYLCEGLLHYFRHTYPYMEYMAQCLAEKRSPACVMEWAARP